MSYVLVQQLYLTMELVHRLTNIPLKWGLGQLYNPLLDPPLVKKHKLKIKINIQIDMINSVTTALLDT